MSHCLICGMTDSGKTTLATGQLAPAYRNAGVKIAVLDPILDPRWNVDFLSDDKAAFLSVMQHPDTFGCAVFIDESAEMVGQYQTEMFWLATRGRHYGHNCHFITQRAKQLAKTVRDQCSYLALFNCSFDDARELANEWNRLELREANILARGEFFWVPRFGDIQRLRAF